MTRRLYFEDAWLQQFEGIVQQVKPRGEIIQLALDQTAFYPEGGGQPSDTGVLETEKGEFRVREVHADEAGVLWHEVEPAEGGSPFPLRSGDAVTGRIDFERRFDHMQQHTGEHILAFCVAKLADGFTHGLHIGQEESSIDVSLPDGRTRLSQETLERIETMANRMVQQNLDIACTFPDEEQMAALPLRKDPTVTEHIRVCNIGNVEAVACGGTHLAASGQVGSVKILRCQPARGKMRLFFLCGKRAEEHYAAVYRALEDAATMLNCKGSDVPGRVEALLQQLKDSQHEAWVLKKESLLQRVPEFLANARVLPGGERVVVVFLAAEEASHLEELAKALIAESGVIALLAAPRGDSRLCLFARAADVAFDMNRLLKNCGIKGGGRPDFARGQCVERTFEAAVREVLGHS